MNTQTDSTRKLAITALGAILCTMTTAFAASNDTAKIITFDVSGIGTASGQGTFPFANNLQGEITGYWVDPKGVGHGFVRHFNGDIVSFDASDGSTLTQGQGINAEGSIVGDYQDSNYVGHGFLRAPHGEITSFDPRDGHQRFRSDNWTVPGFDRSTTWLPAVS